MSWAHLPVPARAIAVFSAASVEAARSADPAGYEEATTRLAALDPQQVGLVLGAVVRALLEDLHPDGLSGDDVRAVLLRCARTQPRADPDALLILLGGALGVHPDAEDARPVDVARQAPLLIADLLAVADAPLTGYLAAAFTEIARAETMELP